MSNEQYVAPKFPPRLEWWEIYRGPDRAGELLAAFELLQKPFDPSDLKAAYLTPPYARKHVSLLANLSDTANQELPSSELPLMTDRGPILPVPKGIRPVLSKHRIEELPDNEQYCPPITIRCVDCRSFGRFTLVGTHVISNLHKFMYVPTTKNTKQALQKLFPCEYLSLVSSVATFL
ncbi:unnamed protein product [Candidula unifasciata]|uniref:Uncharacterized protein n=1 Tax=Candidula unifasciata TaxID=100452 RepID=A0A8S4A0R1_9EUPU|nr:unnamed protein product [Candidula unifasciata]